jgi:hypothetical protein
VPYCLEQQQVVTSDQVLFDLLPEKTDWETRSKTSRLSYLPVGRATVIGFPQRRSDFKPKSRHIGFVVDTVALRQVFSEYFCSSCKSLFLRLRNTYHHHHPSPGAGTIGQTVTDVPSGLISHHPDKPKNPIFQFTLPRGVYEVSSVSKAVAHYQVASSADHVTGYCINTRLRRVPE